MNFQSNCLSQNQNIGSLGADSLTDSLGCEASLEAGGREDQADELDEEESRARPEHQRPQRAREHAVANR